MMKLSETFDAQETNDAKQGWCEETITLNNNGLFLTKNSLVTKFICLQEFFFFIYIYNDGFDLWTNFRDHNPRSVILNSMFKLLQL